MPVYRFRPQHLRFDFERLLWRLSDLVGKDSVQLAKQV